MRNGGKLCAVVPVKKAGDAKQRLASVLRPSERAQLAHAMLEDVLAALAATTGIASMLVVTADREAAGIAARFGAEVTAEQAQAGHTAAVSHAAARLAGRGLDMLALPADIPLVQPDDIAHLLALHGQAIERGTPLFAIVPARDERGSNAVICSPATAIPLRFGDDSFIAHLAAARARGIEPTIARLPRIALDIDRPDDLAALLAAAASTRTRALLHSWRKNGLAALGAAGARSM